MIWIAFRKKIVIELRLSIWISTFNRWRLLWGSSKWNLQKWRISKKSDPVLGALKYKLAIFNLYTYRVCFKFCASLIKFFHMWKCDVNLQSAFLFSGSLLKPIVKQAMINLQGLTIINWIILDEIWFIFITKIDFTIKKSSLS